MVLVWNRSANGKGMGKDWSNTVACSARKIHPNLIGRIRTR